MIHQTNAVYAPVEEASGYFNDCENDWNSDGMEVTWEGLPDPEKHLKRIKEYYPEHKNNIKYMGRGIIVLDDNELYYIVGEIESSDLAIESFLSDTNMDEIFSDWLDVKTFNMKVYIYDKLKPKKS